MEVKLGWGQNYLILQLVYYFRSPWKKFQVNTSKDGFRAHRIKLRPELAWTAPPLNITEPNRNLKEFSSHRTYTN